MPATAPTLEEILAELEATPVSLVEGKTSEEWAEHWGVGMIRARSFLREMCRNGRMVPHYVKRESPLRPGWRCNYTVYSYRPVVAN